MKLSNLFTTSGLFEALKAHHKNLHENYNFPPLKGQKPIHKFAEIFGFKGAEDFTHALQNLKQSDHVTVTLNYKGNEQSVYVYIEELDNTLRVQYDEKDFLILSLREYVSSLPEIHLFSNTETLLTWRNFQLSIEAIEDEIVATVTERDLDKTIIPTVNIKHLINKEDYVMADCQSVNISSIKAEPVIKTYITVLKQEERVYTSVYRSYKEALCALRKEIKEDTETTHLSALSLVSSLEIDINENESEDELIEKLHAKIDTLDEDGLCNAYGFLHECAFAQINESTLV